MEWRDGLLLNLACPVWPGHVDREIESIPTEKHEVRARNITSPLMDSSVGANNPRQPPFRLGDPVHLASQGPLLEAGPLLLNGQPGRLRRAPSRLLAPENVSVHYLRLTGQYCLFSCFTYSFSPAGFRFFTSHLTAEPSYRRPRCCHSLLFRFPSS